jgi:hypothetical protein
VAVTQRSPAYFIEKSKQLPDNPDSPNKGLAKAFEGFVGEVTQKMWRRSSTALAPCKVEASAPVAVGGAVFYS